VNENGVLITTGGNVYQGLFKAGSNHRRLRVTENLLTSLFTLMAIAVVAALVHGRITAALFPDH
jgi:hypothetical protein